MGGDINIETSWLVLNVSWRLRVMMGNRCIFQVLERGRRSPVAIEGLGLPGQETQRPCKRTPHVGMLRRAVGSGSQ